MTNFLKQVWCGMGKIIDLKQNTPEWLAWRKDKIGASDAGAIMGVSPYCTPWQAYMRKLGLIPDQADNRAMANGRERESEALKAFNSDWCLLCKPVVIVHDEFPWMIASLDGYDENEGVAIEIKCPGKEDHECALNGKIPDHYWPQIQHQLAVSGKDFMHYISWKDGKYVKISVKSDDEYIEKLICVELDFMRRLRELDPPELCDRDYVDNHSKEWKNAVYGFITAKRVSKDAEENERYFRDELIRLAGDHNTKGSGAKVAKVLKKGNVDYHEVLDLFGAADMDLDPYRKPTTTHWRVTEE